MNTLFLLMSEFNSIHVPIEHVATKYLSLSRREAMERANKNTLPFPVFRGSESRKAPMLVDLRDVANWLDKIRMVHKKDWEQLQNQEEV